MNKTQSYTPALLIICALFFFFGFITWVNGVLIPYFQICLELTNLQASLVMFASYSSYFVMALPCAKILERTGYKQGMVIGLLIMALGTLLFIPAAYQRTYSLFLLGLYVTGTGLTLLQAAANPYIAVIGPNESTAQRVGFLGLSNKIAGILCISLMGSIFLFRADDIIAQTQGIDSVQKAALLDAYVLKIVNPYLALTAALGLMAVFIYFAHLPEVDDTNNYGASTHVTNQVTILHYPHLLLGVLTLFLATACEMIPIDSVILYSRALGMPMETARQLPNYGLLAMLLGYAASIILIPRYVSQHQALQFAALWGLSLAIIAYFVGGRLSIYCLIGMGFGTALLWGTIWGLALRDLGQHTKIGGALLLMAVIGGAILPLVFGYLIDQNPATPQRAILLLIPLYIGILSYAVWGHRVRR